MATGGSGGRRHEASRGRYEKHSIDFERRPLHRGDRRREGRGDRPFKAGQDVRRARHHGHERSEQGQDLSCYYRTIRRNLENLLRSLRKAKTQGIQIETGDAVLQRRLQAAEALIVRGRITTKSTKSTKKISASC